MRFLSGVAAGTIQERLGEPSPNLMRRLESSHWDDLAPLSTAGTLSRTTISVLTT